MPKISILVPVYRNAADLQELSARIGAALDERWPDYEIIFANDGSPDGSWSVIERLGAEDQRIRGVDLSRNFGQHAAIAAALDHARGERFVLMDADLEDPPEALPRLLEQLAQPGVDIVYTSSPAQPTRALVHRVSSRWFHRLFDRLSGARTPDGIGTFRAFNRKVAEALRSHHERNIVYGPLMHSMGFTTAVIDVDRAARPHGRSSYNLGKRLRLGLRTLFGYTTIPYEIMMIAGGAVMGLCIIYILVILLQALVLGVSLPAGLTLVVVLQVFTLGVVIGCLGLIGNYIYLVYTEALGRPRYLVRTTVNLDPAPSGVAGTAGVRAGA